MFGLKRFSKVQPEDATIFGLADSKGVLVDRVLRPSPADKAGLQVEDVITAVDGTDITSIEQLRSLIADVQPDERVKLRVIRDREEQTVTVRLGLQPEDVAAQYDSSGRDARDIARLGLQVRTFRPGMRGLEAYDNSARGVVVMGFDGNLKNPPEIEPREVVVEVNGTPVRTVAEFQQALTKVPANRNVKLMVLEKSGDKREVVVHPAPKK